MRNICHDVFNPKRIDCHKIVDSVDFCMNCTLTVVVLHETTSFCTVRFTRSATIVPHCDNFIVKY